MGKGTFIATVALLIAIVGAIVAFAAYFKRRNCMLCDDLDEDLSDDDVSDLDYFATQVDDDDLDADDAPVSAECPAEDAPVSMDEEPEE